MYSYGSPHMAAQKQDDQHEHTFSSYVRIRDVVRKTYLGRWTIGRSGERGSGISVLPARYDDDDANIICLQIQEYTDCILETSLMSSMYISWLHLRKLVTLVHFRSIEVYGIIDITKNVLAKTHFPGICLSGFSPLLRLFFHAIISNFQFLMASEMKFTILYDSSYIFRHSVIHVCCIVSLVFCS